MAADHHEHCGCEDGAVCRPLAAAAPLPTVDPTAWRVRRRRAVRRAAGGRGADPAAPGAVSVLLLDMGGVVIPSLFESVGLPGFPGGPFDDEAAWRQVERGEVTERDYWGTVAAERPGLDVAELWRRCSRVRDELRGALDALAGRVRIVAFTNDMSHFFGEDWPQRFPELSAFDAIVEASRLGVHKPDPEAFRAAARAIGERPECCLFVDDLAVNLAGARRAGMRALLFDVRDPAAAIGAVLDELALARTDGPERPRAFRSGPAAQRSAPAFSIAGTLGR
jgi:FMN phosphatase YigB (HAD superfamily)